MTQSPKPTSSSGPTQGKAQKRFNQLLNTVSQRQGQLGEWREFTGGYAQYAQQQLGPHEARLRKAKIALALLLDRMLEGGTLSRRLAEDTREVLLDIASQVLAEAPDEDVRQVYERQRRQLLERLKKIPAWKRKLEELEAQQPLTGAEDVSVDDDDPFINPQSFASDEELRRLFGNQDDDDSDLPPSFRRQAKPAKPAASVEQAQNARRDLYRKLVSSLHPDRELDAELRQQKTELMQQVNQAYESQDLLTLLRLGAEHGATAPGTSSETQLKHYIRALEQQLKALDQQLELISAPFSILLDAPPGARLRPADVRRAVDEEAESMRSMARACEEQLLALSDPRVLRPWVYDYLAELAVLDDPDFLLDELDDVFGAPRSAQRRSSGKSAKKSKKARRTSGRR